MKKTLRFISVYFYHRFKVISTCKEAEKRGLKFDENVYDDTINIWNCRSFWYDEFNFRYRCVELHKIKKHKYNVKTFAKKKDLDLDQIIYHGTNWSSLEDLLNDYADRYYKHKVSFETKGHETNCMNNIK